MNDTNGKQIGTGLRLAVACAAVMTALVAALPAAGQGADPVKPKVTAKAPPAAIASGGGDSGLKARVESLEEQLVDMQVVVGTLESLSKSGGAGSAPSFRASTSGSADISRVEGLENQVRSLSAQVQQLSDQVRGMGGVPRRTEALPPGAAPLPPTAPVQSAESGGFGSTTVSPGGDAIGGLIGGEPATGSTGAAGAGGFGGQPATVATAALPPAGDGSDPKQLYETAYGYLLQRDYGAAEVAFDDFLKKFPSDSLSGNAQYWLGESHFVRGQYKAAAGAFLKGYQTYAQSQKAPDSLLKLAMSLDRLGQKDAACSSFSELNTKFPQAPQSVKARAQSERQRVGCP